jgi:hypothetical protein
MGALAVLDGLAHDRDAGRAQQLAQLRQVVALGQGGDHEGPLLGSAGLGLRTVMRLGRAPVAASLHHVPV